jgi:hypothetical protein
VPARSAYLRQSRLGSWVLDGPSVIDHLDYRLDKARSFAHAETYNFTEYDDLRLPALRRICRPAGAAAL